jgi:hypothetical protein
VAKKPRTARATLLAALPAAQTDNGTTFLFGAGVSYELGLGDWLKLFSVASDFSGNSSRINTDHRSDLSTLA